MTSSAVKDRVNVQLLINDVEIPTDISPLDYVHIVESCRQYVPVLTFSIQDKIKFLTQNRLLIDGSLIKIIITIENRKLEYRFRTFSVKETLSSGGTTFKVSAYLDVPRFWNNTVTRGFSGSISDVLKDISELTDLTYQGVSTLENQLWLPLNKKYCEFSRYISERGLLNNSSCLQLVLTLDKILRYINVTAQFTETEPTDRFSNSPDASEEFKVVTDYRVLTSSGFFNNLSGYKDTRVSQSLITTDSVFNSSEITKNSKNLEISDSIRKSLTQGKTTFAPIDIGNTSLSYEEAIYQNRRLSNLFSSGVELVTPRPVDGQVLDVIYADLSKPGLSTVDTISGKALITSKVMYIEGLNFYQKLEVFRHGNNSNTSLDLS